MMEMDDVLALFNRLVVDDNCRQFLYGDKIGGKC